VKLLFSAIFSKKLVHNRLFFVIHISLRIHKEYLPIAAGIPIKKIDFQKTMLLHALKIDFHGSEIKLDLVQISKPESRLSCHAG
jgi:hypothetical protein